MILCEWDAPEGDPGQSCVHLFARILSTSFSSLSIFSVYCYSGVSISVITHIHTFVYSLSLVSYFPKVSQERNLNMIWCTYNFNGYPYLDCVNWEKHTYTNTSLQFQLLRGRETKQWDQGEGDPRIKHTLRLLIRIHLHLTAEPNLKGFAKYQGRSLSVDCTAKVLQYQLPLKSYTKSPPIGIASNFFENLQRLSRMKVCSGVNDTGEKR